MDPLCHSLPKLSDVIVISPRIPDSGYHSSQLPSMHYSQQMRMALGMYVAAAEQGMPARVDAHSHSPYAMRANHQLSAGPGACFQHD